MIFVMFVGYPPRKIYFEYGRLKARWGHGSKRDN
jgi:hypothetical protein